MVTCACASPALSFSVKAKLLSCACICGGRVEKSITLPEAKICQLLSSHGPVSVHLSGPGPAHAQ